MKTIAMLLLLAAPAASSPYFRPIGPGNYHILQGGLWDPAQPLRLAQNVTEIALITHSTKDGSILPQSWVDAGFAEPWTPLAVGGAFGGGSGTLSLGPRANVVPLLQMAILQGLSAITGPTSFINLKSFLINLHAVKDDGTPDLTISAGPSWSLEVIRDGQFLPMNSWSGRFKLYFGGQLHF